MRSFLSRVALIVLLAAVTLVYPILAPPPHRIDQAHYDLVRDGMTLEEVEAIFGVPAGQYDWAAADYSVIWHDIGITNTLNSGATYDITVGFRTLPIPEALADMRWVSRHGAFTFSFNGQGRLASRSAWHTVRIDPPWQRWWRAVWQR
jgi:hypothetical protein